LFAAVTVGGQTREARPRNCSLSGRVIVNGQPVAHATVTVQPAETEDYQAAIAGKVENFFAKTLTDAEGRYHLTNLLAGRLIVRALSKAYISREDATLDYDERRAGGRFITLVAGEQRTDFDFELVRGGVITGRITDERGRPLHNETLHLFSLDEHGRFQQSLHNLFAMGQGTDDRGIYRLYGLPPGRYAIAAGAGRFEYKDQAEDFNGSRHRLTFYPDATSPEKAKLIEVQEGDELTGIDLKLPRLNKGAAYAASGCVVDAETGKPVPGAWVWLGRNSDRSLSRVAQLWSDNEGVFRFTGLTAGKYRVRYLESADFGQARETGYFADEVSFEVTEAEIKGLEVRLQRGATISGVVVLEGANASAGLPLTVTKLPHWKELNDQQAGEQTEPLSPDWASAEVGEGGRFRMIGLRPGRFTLAVAESFGHRKPLKLLRVERYGMNLGNALELGPREHLSGLRLVALRGTGALRGQVKFTGGTLPAGTRLYVSVVLEQALQQLASDGRVEVFGNEPETGSAIVDEAGRFLIEGLLPGNYVLSFRALQKREEDALPFEPVQQRVFINAQGETPLTITIELGKKRPQ
jgi:protocatechuate 3,4-dioxygenase beta subunit/5-hydroxyisourate hydrolase-like protein (transthyretin family)